MRGLLQAAASRPRRVLLVWGVVCGVATTGVLQLRVETSTDSILSRSDPAWTFYRKSVDLFGGDEIIVVGLEAEEPFAAEALAEIQRLTKEIEQVPGVRRVDSLASVPNVRASADGTLNLDPVLTDHGGREVDAEALSKAVFADRLAPRTLVSDDARVLAVNVLMRDLGADYDRGVVNGVRDALGETPAWVTGGPVFRTETNDRMQREMLIFLPLTVAIVGGLLLVIFRSVRAAWISLATAGLGTWVMLGALGISGVPLTIATMILPSILLALGSAYVMHLLFVGSGAPSREALELGIAQVARPIALSGLTTAIGFVSMTMVRIDSIQYLGIFGAIGVLAVLAAALSAAPACLQLWPLPPMRPAGSQWIQGPLTRALVGMLTKRRRAVLVAWAAVLGIASVGIARIEVETDVTRWFPVGSVIRDSYEEIRARLSGISPMNVVVNSEGGEPVTRAEVIGAIDGLDRFLEGIPEVGKVLSVADPLRQLHGGFTGDERMPLPKGDDEIAEYLVLLESVEHLEDVLTYDYRQANVVLRVNDNGSVNLLDVARRADEWWKENGPAGFSARTTGIMFEYARAEDEIAVGQLRGLGVAIGVIGVLLLVIFGKTGVALAALVPNAVPIGVAFGAMGGMGVPLDAGTVSVGCLALGIAVDDTIHLVTGFRNRRQRGLPPAASLQETLTSLLAPVVYTTLVVTAGFLVLGVSGFLIIRNLGLVTAGLMILCLLADVTLLTALLLGRNRRASP